MSTCYPFLLAQHMTSLAEKQGDLWCHLLAIFSQSQQNQQHMASKRHPTRVLSCMHLNMMASKARFQQHGLVVLANTVSVPTPPGGKVGACALTWGPQVVASIERFSLLQRYVRT